MKIQMHGEENITFSEFHQLGFEVVSDDPAAHYSALQMFATSLALCTYSVLASYGEQIGAGSDDLSINVQWQYVEKPFRIGAIDMTLHWPELPASRLKAAQRAASQCTLHNTLLHPPVINTEVAHESEA